MNQYEILYIVSAGLDESAYAEIADKYAAVVTDRGGEVEGIDKWGIKKLAYPINFKTEGYYIVMKFSADSATPAEIERQMRLSDQVIRFLITNRK